MTEKLCPAFDGIIELGSVKPIQLPARSPNLNSFSERWVKSVKEECLSKLILFGEAFVEASEPFNNTNFIIMKKEIIKAKRITCCFFGRLKRWVAIRSGTIRRSA